MSFVEIRELPAEIGIISRLARALLNTCQTQPREEAMFIKFTSKLDQAIALSIAAMLAMTVVVLSQQLTAPTHVALQTAAPTAQQA